MIMNRNSISIIIIITSSSSSSSSRSSSSSSSICMVCIIMSMISGSSSSSRSSSSSSSGSSSSCIITSIITISIMFVVCLFILDYLRRQSLGLEYWPENATDPEIDIQHPNSYNSSVATCLCDATNVTIAA